MRKAVATFAEAMENKLKDNDYKDGWFEKAVEEAKSHDAKAPMRYIEKILESWREKEEPGEVTTDNQGIQVI